MNYYDFGIRAWIAPGDQVNVIVHNSPAGSLRRPIAVPLDPAMLSQVHHTLFKSFHYGQENTGWFQATGAWLGGLLLPAPIVALLKRSLQRVDPDGIRLRLCLDEDLIDLPWEYLVVQSPGDAEDMHSMADLDGPNLQGFIATNKRLSIVREAPSLNPRYLPSTDQQRLVFAGGIYGDDTWQVKREFDLLHSELSELEAFLTIDQCIPARNSSVFDALSRDAAIFHYAGDVGDSGDDPIMVGDMPSTWKLDDLMAHPDHYILASELGQMLQNSHTRLAVFTACNSGYWPFAKELLTRGLPAMIGFQGNMSVEAALHLSATLYKYLCSGLALDEAVNTVRRFLARPGGGYGFLWGALMVYMPTPEPILLPRPATAEIQALQGRIQQQPLSLHIERYIAAAEYREGDTVHGDKVGGDKVGGDKIEVGNVSNASGIAFGRESRAAVTEPSA